MRKLSATVVRFSGVALFLAAGCAEIGGEPQEEIAVREEALVGDASLVPVADTVLKNAAPNSNSGQSSKLEAAFPPRTRSVMRFDTAAISAAAAGREVVQAQLELTIDQCGWGWIFGQRVSVHAMKKAWTEAGATWNCANDTQPNNMANNSTTANKWKMTGANSQLAFDANETDSSGMFSGQHGKVVLDVTADVQAFLAGTKANHGWLVKKLNEVPLGQVHFGSRESSKPPRLVLTFNGGGGGTGGVGGTGGAGTGGTGGAPACVPSAANDVTCNGVDDDCDGQVDEDFASSATSCGVGACASSGATSCVAGAVVDSCTAGAPAANDVSCDGVDNDCNGQVDDGFVSTATNCGVGACAATGATSCVAGAVIDSCTAGTPAANDASCDGIDNNCNGFTDEGFVATVTNCGLGACVATGLNSCVAGTIVDSCMAGTPAANDATCNNVDDDCDGTADEDYAPVPTSCGTGACASTGMTMCSSGVVTSSCTPGFPAPNDALCDGIDNDCNGQIDEDYVSTPTTCGLNACASTGALTCSGGSIVDSCVPVPNCEGDCENGNDDDSDGDVDCDDFDCEGVASCQLGVGLGCDDNADCASLGAGAMCLTEDTSGIAGGYCTLGCDGSPNSCPSGSECVGGSLCFVPCGVGATCDAGEMCVSFGTEQDACLPSCSDNSDCTGGNVCDTGSGFCQPPTCAADDTTCDGVDDDCDGSFDEDYAVNFGGDVSCGAESCFEVGSVVCVAGVVTDTCGAPDPSCTQETACGDATDNDGDSFVDCADPDCEQTPACLADASPVGGTCSADGDCRSVTGAAECLAVPGGYCTNGCDDMDPSTCPDNAACSDDGFCKVRCNPADANPCIRPDLNCVLESGNYVCS